MPLRVNYGPPGPDGVTVQTWRSFATQVHSGEQAPSSRPLVVNGGDTVRIHFFVAGATEGWHIQITDLTTSHSGTVVLNSKYGPLLPAFSQQKIGKALGWGLVDDTPNSFVWEIGHTSPFTGTAARYCSAYGGLYCIYPWYAYNGADSAFTYGADYLGSQDGLRPGRVRDCAPVRRPVRSRLHLLRHRA